MAGGRRIKRSFSVDVSTVRFLTSEEIERFGSWSLLKDYISGKVDELASHNAETSRNAELNADIRRLTNIGTLRAYIEQYLRTHPKIHGSGYTLLVRQLAIGATGVPIEIYCFSNDQDWGRYEGIQADIFDHIFAIIHEFGLRLYQQPAGADLANVMEQRPGG